MLWNSKSVFRSTNPVAVLSAAFGKYVRFRADDFNPDPPSYEFQGQAALTPAKNTTISAIVILTKYRLDNFQVETWQRLRVKSQRGEKIEPADQFALLQRLSEKLGNDARYSYGDTVRVIVLENPHARILFPSDLFVGPFDQHWGLKAGRFELSFMGAELEHPKQEGVPFDYL